MKVLKTLPLAVVAALGLGMNSDAQADAYAVSASNITDLIITTTPFVGILPGAPTSESTATLNGASAVSSTATNALAVNAPGSNPGNTRADNVFNQFGQTNANYSNADAVIDSQQTSGAVFTQVREIGESFIKGDSTAGSSSENGSTTGFFFDATIAVSTVLDFDFNAFKYLQAALTADAKIPGSSASADMDAEITIVDVNTGATIFSWNPDGIAGGIFGGTENADAFTLNQVVSTVFPGTSPTQTSGAGCTINAGTMASGTASVAGCFGAFSATTNAIGPGQYSIGLTVKNGTTLQSVPEPGTMLLMGLGLLGFGATARRRRTA